MANVQSSQRLVWSRKAFQKKNGKKLTKKEAAAMEVSSSLSGRSVPESLFKVSLFSFFLVCGTYYSASSNQQAVLSRRGETRKMQTSALCLQESEIVVSVESLKVVMKEKII